MSKDQLKEERMKVLDLLAKGIITSEEAEKLLNAMDKSNQDYQEQDVVLSKKKSSFRMLKIFVDSKGGDVVKIQLPIEFAKLLKTKKFNINLEENDIDIDAILEMVNQGFVGEIVNVESADGDTVRIVVE